jgi:DNA-binding IclR family transcriptional regulator
VAHAPWPADGGNTGTAVSSSSARVSFDRIERAYNVAALDRALDLLETLSRIGPVSLAALADACGCTRTAAFRLLRTLEARGFAVQEGSRGLWSLGARWRAFAHAAQSPEALIATVTPYAQALALDVGEPVYFLTRVGEECTATVVARPVNVTQLQFEPNQTFPLHAGPQRLLLAHAPDQVVAQVLSKRLRRFTPSTRTDPTWIAQELPRLRERGWLSTTDEIFGGMVSVSAPVRDCTTEVIGILVIMGHVVRMKPPRPRSILPTLLDYAARISDALGAPATPNKSRARAPRMLATPRAPRATRAAKLAATEAPTEAPTEA